MTGWLWTGGEADFGFSLSKRVRSAQLAPGERWLSFKSGMPHAHGPAAAVRFFNVKDAAGRISSSEPSGAH